MLVMLSFLRGHVLNKPEWYQTHIVSLYTAQGAPDLKTAVNITKVKVHVHLGAPRLGVLVSYNFRQAFQRSQTAKKWNKSLTVRDPFKLEVKILNAHIKKICMCTVMQLFY